MCSIICSLFLPIAVSVWRMSHRCWVEGSLGGDGEFAGTDATCIITLLNATPAHSRAPTDPRRHLLRPAPGRSALTKSAAIIGKIQNSNSDEISDTHLPINGVLIYPTRSRIARPKTDIKLSELSAELRLNKPSTPVSHSHYLSHPRSSNSLFIP